MDNLSNLLAHYDIKKTHRKQLLLDHLLDVSLKSKEIGSQIGLENSSQLIGLLHDFGKNSREFQLYIMGQYKGRVNHSSAGAIILGYISEIVFKEYDVESLLEESNVGIDTWKLYKEILQYPILAHHGLYDIIDSNNEYRTGKRLHDYPMDKDGISSRDMKFLSLLNKLYTELNGLTVYQLYYEGFKEFIKIFKMITSMAPKVNPSQRKETRIIRAKTLHFYYGALVRLLLSILKEADIYDSSNYYRVEKDKTYTQDELNDIWKSMEEAVEELYTGFKKDENKSELNTVRTSLADEMYSFSKEHDRGTFKLDMPVGSGKTYAGLRYAVGNAREFKKSRIFYTTAFLSVLEQNADEIKNLLGDKYILEHHSNIIQEYDGTEEEQDRKEYQIGEYLKESWEAPVVLTTLVQLSNTMFKGRASNIRRFSKLVDSVIIIDEIQSLPTKAIYNFNLMTNFLANVMNATIIHSTATPPGYDNEKALLYPCIYGDGDEKTSIIENTKGMEVFERVDYYSLLGKDFDLSLDGEQLTNHIKEQIKDEKSALIVLNTKKAVSNLYDRLLIDSQLEKEDIEIIYLTTNQCPAHRLDIIKKMKEDLKSMRKSGSGRKIICISTKLVEAGVDIDFDVVYRSLAGIDNIVQVGGRCNREGKKDSKGKVFILKYDGENLNYLPDIKKQREASISSLTVLKKENLLGGTVDIDKARKHYFHKLYQNEEGAGNHLEYIIKNKDETVLNLISNNPKGRGNYRNNKGKEIHFKLRQSFKTVAQEFDLIKEDTINVIVQYKNDEKLKELYEVIEKNDYYNIKRILQTLQPYTIGIRNISEYERYVSRQLDGEVLILSKEAYDDNIGLIKGELQTLAF